VKDAPIVAQRNVSRGEMMVSYFVNIKTRTLIRKVKFLSLLDFIPKIQQFLVLDSKNLLSLDQVQNTRGFSSVL